MSIDLKVIFEDNNYLSTGFNGTLEEAKAYYVGTTFTVAHKRTKGKEVHELTEDPKEFRDIRQPSTVS